MCRMCDGPVSDFMLVMEDTDDPGAGAAYTVGMTAKRMPELVVFFNHDDATRAVDLLGDVATRQVASGLPFEDGQPLTDGHGGLVTFAAFDATELEDVVARFGEQEPSALTVVAAWTRSPAE
jgi:hypothetical protein